MSKPYLLIVDDEEDIIEIQEGLLSALGFEQLRTALVHPKMKFITVSPIKLK